jgi:3-hydroxy-9,10-secoandrosta-1,3,5(10)-triene-9,17-dione monooxygenase reductase component
MQGTFDPQRFRKALGAFTTGVTIITAVDAAGADVGMTANSFNSVSLTPPLVLWSIARNSTNVEAFLQAKHFAVHVLESEQDALANLFATRGVDRFAGLKLGRGLENLPLLDGVAARFECRTAFQYDGGDHVIIVGEVLAFDHWEHEPLVFKRGRYSLAVGKAPSKPESKPAAPTGPEAFERDFLAYLLGRAHHQLHARLRPELARLQLGDAEHAVLSTLGVRDELSAAELDAMHAYTGVRIDATVVERLQKLGFVAASEPKGERLKLTDAGRSAAAELVASARAAVAEGDKAFDPSEARALRQLLVRFIEATDPGLPTPWQK